LPFRWREKSELPLVAVYIAPPAAVDDVPPEPPVDPVALTVSI